MDRYHYLGYTPLPGAQMRYLVTSQRRVLAVVGFGASAWKAAPRDRFIGWSVAQREARLQLVVNNARFLILPWVQVRNLASTVLARSSRRLPDDWQARYGYRPLLLETFVQSDRFAGTSYRAANWTHVGQTQGRGKLDVHRTHALPRKDIWLYPLRRDFRRRLCAPLQCRRALPERSVESVRKSSSPPVDRIFTIWHVRVWLHSGAYPQEIETALLQRCRFAVHGERGTTVHHPHGVRCQRTQVAHQAAKAVHRQIIRGALAGRLLLCRR